MKTRLIPMLFAALASLPLALPAQAETPAPASSAQAAAVRININEADAETLSRELKGIGPSKAKAIVDYRNEQGSFVSVDELLEVSGIGVATLERIRDQLSID